MLDHEVSVDDPHGQPTFRGSRSAGSRRARRERVRFALMEKARLAVLRAIRQRTRGAGYLGCRFRLRGQLVARGVGERKPVLERTAMGDADAFADAGGRIAQTNDYRTRGRSQTGPRASKRTWR